MVERSISPEQTISKPEFDGGAFAISHFAPTPEGFTFRTRRTIRRTDGDASNHLTPDDKMRLRSAMQGELRFNGVTEVQNARNAWRYGDGSEEDFLQAREAYQKKGKKLTLRNIELDGSTIHADVGYVSFPVYNLFANIEESNGLVDLSANAAAAMILRSADNKLVIQHRAVAKQRLSEEKMARGNAQFCDVPGASVAGMLDAVPGEEKGKPKAVDTQSILDHIYKETGEELGLDRADLKNVRIMGIARDNVKIHDELLLVTDSHLTAGEITEKSRNSKRNKNLGEADFEEKYITIGGSSDNIKTLLTNSLCPLPPTHAAALITYGYTAMLEEQGKEQADIWKGEVEKGVKENYQRIDDTVKKFYDTYPQALLQIPERFWDKTPPKRKLHRYDPAYTPEEQGLPNFEDEMVRMGLMPETRRHVSEAKIFDIDGVITNPKEKKVLHPEILDMLRLDLRSGLPIALNTGRSMEWLDETFLRDFEESFGDDRSGLANLAVITEFGGTWATYDKDGKRQDRQVTSLTVPDNVVDAVDALVQDRFGETMFVDKTKKTMISIEMHDGHDLAPFKEQQAVLSDSLNVLLESHGIGNLEVHNDTIATNLRSHYVGKDVGTDRFMEFLREREIVPRKFKAFGDSEGDIAMAEKLAMLGRNVDMIYLGNDVPKHDYNGYRFMHVRGYDTALREYYARD